MHVKRVERLRTNAASPAFTGAIRALRKEADEGAKITYRIGPREAGQWTHYYHCHEDGSQLVFDWNQPFSHPCPTCGKIRTGEPYDSAWTSIAHNQIGRAVYHNALLYAVEGEQERLLTAKGFLLAYAAHYAGYGIHGDIPYNGPGKLFAQTLDEAHWIADLLVGFDLMKEQLTHEEYRRIADGLFRACAEFLILHKEEQIHNHAVLITSAIAAIGLVLQDEDILKSGLNGEYGLLDQLDRGLLGDGLWYEGNLQYHFYAFAALLHYALLAEGTSWELWKHPGIQPMFDYPLGFITPFGGVPTWNDAGLGHGLGTYAPYYEIALDIYGDEMYRALLHTAYGTPWADPDMTGVRTARRDSVFALLYGTELQPLAGSPRMLSEAANAPRSCPDSGITKLVNESGWQVILRHSKFGGEHDHMDRLGISVTCGEVPLLIDPGTTAYGVPAHYGWFKHTFSHNTVSIGGADQPPRDGQLVQLVNETWGTWAEMAVDWLEDDYLMKGKILLPSELCPWDHELYRGCRIRRIIALTGDHMLDLVRVDVPEPREVYLTNHVSGMLHFDSDMAAWETTEEALGCLDQAWLSDKRRLVTPGQRSFRYFLSNRALQHMVWGSQQMEVFAALTPDNPPSSQRTTFLQRVKAENSVFFVQAFAMGSGEELEGSLKVTKLERDESRLDVVIGGIPYRYALQWESEKAKLCQIDT
jgi:hypothetical protein